MQQIIVIIIIILTFAFIAWRIYKLFTKKNTHSNKCVGCDIDCALRDLQPKDCDKTDRK